MIPDKGQMSKYEWTPFTDADLKRVKVACLLSIDEHHNKDAKDILAIISRLEAAEELIESAGDLKRSEAAAEWRKAAGK